MTNTPIEERRVLEVDVRRAGATLGKMLIDEWHLPPDAVHGFLEDTYRHWDVFYRSVPIRHEQWVCRRILTLARAYMERRGIEPHGPAPQDQAPDIIDVIRDQAALDTLPPKVAQVFTLWVRGRLSDHIADELNVSERYVRKLINVALSRLRAWRPRRED